MKNSRFDNHPKPAFMQRLPGIVFLLWIILVATSCGNIKNLQYVQGEFDTTQLSKIQFNEPLIQKGDLLGITIYSDDVLATASVTTQAPPAGVTGTTATSNMSIPSPGFLVDQQGNIQLYKLGVIHAEGKTKKQLADTLTHLYVQNDLLKNPYAEVRFLNYKITLVGEVMRPGTYTIPTERVGTFEALGLAGDITIYGRRDNVLVVRETNGTRQFGRLDLSKPDVFLSPFYYLQQNDMVIVDVGKNKSALNNQVTVRNITIGASILSVIAIFINVFRR